VSLGREELVENERELRQARRELDDKLEVGWDDRLEVDRDGELEVDRDGELEVDRDDENELGRDGEWLRKTLPPPGRARVGQARRLLNAKSQRASESRLMTPPSSKAR
jgi:hypothetical protein